MQPEGNFHALVTGASGAIGGALARLIRKQHPGARLSLVDRDAETSKKLERELGGEARTVAADLSDIPSIPAVHGDAVKVHGPVDLLINCAGIMDVRSMQGMPWEAGERVLLIDLMAPMRLMNLCVPSMVETGGGAIVNVSSMAGRVLLKGCSYYGAAKAGIASASEIARRELAPKNVRVVTVYPGPIASALEKGARGQYEDSFMSRSMPNGDPVELARRILVAIRRNEPEVVYPDIYKLGSVLKGFGGVADWIGLSVGPGPKE